MQQFNYAAIVTSSLDDIGSSKYIGVEGGASEIFVGITPLATTLEGGLQYQKDSKAAIEQVFKQYTDVTSEVFNAKLSLASLSSGAALESTLLTQLKATQEKLSRSSDRRSHLMNTFITNNKTYFETNIHQLATYLEVSGLLKAIKVSKEPLKSAKALLQMFTDGVINEWRETMYERIAGKTEISKIEGGIGVIFLGNLIPNVYLKLGVSIRHRRNNYISLENQKRLDANVINAGKIDEQDAFLPEPPTVKAYAQYLESVFSVTEK